MTVRTGQRATPAYGVEVRCPDCDALAATFVYDRNARGARVWLSVVGRIAAQLTRRVP